MSRTKKVGSQLHWGVGVVMFPLLFLGCESYQPRPVDLPALLSRLNGIRVGDFLARKLDSKGKGLGIREAVFFALKANPGLAAFRRQLEVAKLGVDAAGLFPDIEIGWDAMDVVAVESTGGKAEAEQFISGLGLSFRLPRPGELGAQKDYARAKSEEASQALLQAEWLLSLRTSFAWLRVKRLEVALRFHEEALENAKRLAAFFVEARSIGAATSMEENLALVERARIEAEIIRQRGEQERARRQLNAFLGVPPSARFPLGPVPKNLWEEGEGDAAVLSRRALERRPDLGRLMARYQQAEESLRLEISRQWPGLWLGTGIRFSLPIFSGFNGPRIKVARAIREKRKEDLLAAIHKVRAEIAEALATKRQADLVWGVLKKGMLPAAERNLNVLKEALDSGRVTLLETLIGQRQIIDARLQELDARMKRVKASLRLKWACGEFPLGPADGDEGKPEVEDESKGKR